MLIYILVPKTVPPRDIAVRCLTLKTDAVFPSPPRSRGAVRGGSDYMNVAQLVSTPAELCLYYIVSYCCVNIAY